MRKLVRHVTRPSRIRRHHVLLAAVGFGLLLHEANSMIRSIGETKQHAARDTERRMLQEFELWSLHDCPTSAMQFNAGRLDPWGHPYQIVCDQTYRKTTLAIVSYGPDDGDVHDDLSVVQTFWP